MNREELIQDTLTNLQRRTRFLEKEVDRLRRQETAGPDRVLSAFLTLPGLRGLWPFTSMGDSGAGVDLSGQGRALTNNNSVDFAHSDKIGHAAYTAASSHYFSRADEAGLDIFGNEAYVASDIQGLTAGGWFWFNDEDVVAGMIAKDNFVAPATGDSSFALWRRNTNVARFLASSSGAGSSSISGNDSPLLTAGGWFFVVGQWRPNDPTFNYMVSVNNVPSYAAGGPSAPLFNATAPLEIGRRQESTGSLFYLDGRSALCFLCAAAVPESQLGVVFECSRGFFGV